MVVVGWRTVWSGLVWAGAGAGCGGGGGAECRGVEFGRGWEPSRVKEEGQGG